MKLPRLPEITIALLLLAPAAAGSPAPYVQPESLWPFRAFEILLMVLGFFAAYRAIRSKLPPGDDVVEKQEKEKLKAARDGKHTSTYEAEPVPLMQTTAAPPAKNPKANAQALAVMRGTGLLFMVAGSALGFNSGGIDYGPLHIEEDAARIFGAALFVVGLLDFAVMPKILAGKMRAERK